LPVRQELGGFLRDISGHLGDEQFTDQLIEPGSPTREELFHTLPIIMRFKGSYLTSVDFFKRIDEMERLTRIQKLKITKVPLKGDNSDAILDIELQLNIYFTES
jgi:Tfp pilus assembly protein PilO